jgi:hypothetical protein
MAAFADEDSYKFERLLTLLRTAEDKQLLSMIGEIDLSDGTAITFTYLDRFTVKMPWDADIAYKLGNVRTVVEQLYGKGTKTRFRPHHFPFTEPSCEMDVQCHKCGGVGCPTCKGEGWIELLGAGMVHPKVLTCV